MSVLNDAHYHETITQVNAVQAQLRIDLRHLVQQTDRVAQTLAGLELTHYLTQQSAKAAELGLQRYRTLAAELITQATDLGPLNYHQDLNL